MNSAPPASAAVDALPGVNEVMVFAMPSESVGDCIRRHGHDPDDVTVRITVVRWACESDARL